MLPYIIFYETTDIYTWYLIAHFLEYCWRLYIYSHRRAKIQFAYDLKHTIIFAKAKIVIYVRLPKEKGKQHQSAVTGTTWNVTTDVGKQSHQLWKCYSRTVLEQREAHLRTVNNILVLYLGVEKHISVTLIQLKLALDEKSSVKPDSLSSSACETSLARPKTRQTSAKVSSQLHSIKSMVNVEECFEKWEIKKKTKFSRIVICYKPWV